MLLKNFSMLFDDLTSDINQAKLLRRFTFSSKVMNLRSDKFAIITTSSVFCKLKVILDQITVLNRWSHLTLTSNHQSLNF